MECDTLKRLIKNWYLQVQDESLAPARMVMFMRDHVRKCTTCLVDSLVNREIDRIIERYLPADKIPEEIKVHDRASLSMAALAAMEISDDDEGKNREDNEVEEEA